MILIDYRDRRPIYEQIVERFQELIMKGVLKQDEKLPSVRNLAVELSINPNTIQRAYAELERLGFIYCVKGKGNFVAYDQKVMDAQKEELLKKLQALVTRAENIGVHKAEFLLFVEEVYRRYENDRSI